MGICEEDVCSIYRVPGVTMKGELVKEHKWTTQGLLSKITQLGKRSAKLWSQLKGDDVRSAPLT